MKVQKMEINYKKIEEVMKQEVEDNFFTRCKICGIVVSDVTKHLNSHKGGLKMTEGQNKGLKTETYKQFLRRVENDSFAYNMIMEDYFSGHPDYNAKTDKIEKVQ